MPVVPASEELDRTTAPDTVDAELVRRAQLGSAAAFEQLAVTFGPGIHRFLSLRLRDEHDVRDALQETLTAAWQGLPRLQEPAKLRAWLLGIAANKAADAARRHPPGTHAAEPAGREDDSLLEVRQAILALPPHFREALLLRYIVELSEEEAAAALGIRVGTLKSRTARARAALSKLLQ